MKQKVKYKNELYRERKSLRLNNGKLILYGNMKVNVEISMLKVFRDTEMNAIYDVQ